MIFTQFISPPLVVTIFIKDLNFIYIHALVLFIDQKNIDDGKWGKIEFEIASDNILIETKFNEKKAEVNTILASIHDKLIRYKDSPTIRIIYL